MKKLIRGCLVLGAVAILGLGVAVLVLRSWLDPDRLMPLLLARLGDAAGVELQAESASFAGFTQLDLVNLRASGPLGAGCLEATAELLRVGYRIRPLLERRLVIDDLLLQRPDLVLQESCPADGGAAAAEAPVDAPESGTVDQELVAAEPAPSSGTADVSLEIARLALSDASFRVMPLEGLDPSLSIDGVEVVLSDVALGGASFWRRASGTLNATRLAAGDIVADSIEGDLTVEEGVLKVSPLRLSVPQASLENDVVATLTADPLEYTLATRGAIDLDATLGAGSGAGLGTGVLRFDARGYGADPLDLGGTGTVALPAGTLAAQPAIAAIAVVLGAPELASVSYEATEAKFGVDRGKLELLEPLAFVSPTASLVFEGGATLEGTLALDVRAELPRASVRVKEIPREVLDLLENDEGWVTVPMQLVGSLEAPSARLDADALAGVAKRGAKREAKRRLFGELRRRLDGN